LLPFIDRTASRIGRFAMSPRWVLAIWAFILCSVFILRAFFFTGTDSDDAEQLICMQNWALSCGPRNPPLFTWLGLLVQPIVGQNFVSVILVKFSVMAACLFLLYRSSLLVLKDKALASLVTLSPIGIYYFAWDAIFHYTHSVMVAFAVCLTFYLLLLLERRPSLWLYLLFGLSIGVGALSKFNYLLFLLALLAGASADRDLRRIVLDARMLLAALIGAVTAAPYYVWLWNHRSWASALAKDRFTPGADTYSFIDFSGLGELFISILNFVLPLTIFLVVCFPWALGPAGARDAVSARYRRLLEITFLVMLAMCLIGVVGFGASRIRTHYMFVLILFPLLFIARAQAAEASSRARNLFAATLVVLAVIVPSGVAIKYAIDPLRGSKAYFHVPYAKLAADLKQAGFTKGTIVGDSLGYPLAGNFLPYFPDSRIVNLLDWQLEIPDDIGSDRAIPVLSDQAQGQCLIIWTPDGNGERKAIAMLRTRELLWVDLPKDVEARHLIGEFHNGRGREITFDYILLPGTGNCR